MQRILKGGQLWCPRVEVKITAQGSGNWKSLSDRIACWHFFFFFFLLEIFLLRYTYSLQKKNGNINTGCIEGRAELLIGKES